MDSEDPHAVLAAATDRWTQWIREVLADKELSDETKSRKIADSLDR